MRVLSGSILALVLVMAGAAGQRSAGQPVRTAQYDIAPEEFIHKLVYIHASTPYQKITFDIAGQAHAEGQIFIFRLSDNCDISGRGSFSLNDAGKLVVKAEDIKVSCGRILRLVEETIGREIKNYFTIPDLEKMAREEKQEFIVLSPEEAAIYATLGAIDPVEPGQAVLLGAHRELIDFMLEKFSARSRKDAIIALQKREVYLRYFENRQEPKDKGGQAEFTHGALSSRVDMDWDTGKIRSAVLRYPWGEPKVTVSQTLFANRWVWQTVKLEATVQGYDAIVTVSAKLSNYELEQAVTSR